MAEITNEKAIQKQRFDEHMTQLKYQIEKAKVKTEQAIVKLRQQLVEAKEEILALKRTNAKDSELITGLQRSLKKKEEDYEELVSQHTDDRKHMQLVAKQQKQTLEVQNDEMKRHTEEKVETQSTIVQLMAELEKFKADNENLVEQLSNAKTTGSHLRSKFKDVMMKVTELDQAKSFAAISKSTTEREIADLVGTLERETAYRGLLETKLEERRVQLLRKADTIRQLKRRVLQLEAILQRYDEAAHIQHSEGHTKATHIVKQPGKKSKKSAMHNHTR